MLLTLFSCCDLFWSLLEDFGLPCGDRLAMVGVKRRAESRTLVAASIYARACLDQGVCSSNGFGSSS